MKTALELKGEGLTVEEIAQRLELTVPEVEKQLEPPRISPQQRIETWQALQKKPWTMPIAAAFIFGAVGGLALGVMRAPEKKEAEQVTLKTSARSAAVLSFHSVGSTVVTANGIELGEFPESSGLTDVLIPPEVLNGSEPKIHFQGGIAVQIHIDQFPVPLPHVDDALPEARALMTEAETAEPYEAWKLYRAAWVALQRARIQPYDEEMKARAHLVAARERLDEWCRKTGSDLDLCPR